MNATKTAAAACISCSAPKAFLPSRWAVSSALKRPPLKSGWTPMQASPLSSADYWIITISGHILYAPIQKGEIKVSRKLPEIKQRKDGYFEQKVTISPNNRKSVYGATKAEVRRNARELIAEALRYDISNVKKMTVSTYMTHWLEDIKSPSWNQAHTTEWSSRWNIRYSLLSVIFR